MKKIITTVGTSIFSNNLSGDELDKVEKLKNRSATEEWTHDRRKVEIDRLKTTTWNKVKSMDTPGICAEIQSLVALLSRGEEDEVDIYLIASDTIVSRLAAEIIQQWILENMPNVTPSFNPEKDVIKGLQINDYTKFRNIGIQELINRLNEITKGEDENELLINISGGYKAVLPLLTVYGQLYNIKLIYQYEESDELIEVDPMPLHFNWSDIEMELPFLLNLEKINSDKVKKRLESKHLILENEGKCERTIIGTLLADYARNNETPFFNTILGYIVEFKLYEILKEQYPDAIPGYKPKALQGVENKDWDDVDILLLKKSEERFIACEVKPFSKIRKSRDFKSLIKKLCKRSKMVREDFSYSLEELWVIFYSKDDITPLTDAIKANIQKGKEKIMEELGTAIPLRIKLVKIQSNEVDGQNNRLMYHDFLRQPLPQNCLDKDYHYSK